MEKYEFIWNDVDIAQTDSQITLYRLFYPSSNNEHRIGDFIIVGKMVVNISVLWIDLTLDITALNAWDHLLPRHDIRHEER
jgi:hypothetical protein